MEFLEPEIRHPTRDAIEKLALLFDLPNNDGMQDWEWEVADSERIDEFLEVYSMDSITDDERFVLLEMLLQSFEDSEIDIENDIRWQSLLELINKYFKIHSYTIWYWSCFDTPEVEHRWRISKYMRNVCAENV